jgi:hypothetical protein
MVGIWVRALPRSHIIFVCVAGVRTLDFISFSETQLAPFVHRPPQIRNHSSLSSSSAPAAIGYCNSSLGPFIRGRLFKFLKYFYHRPNQENILHICENCDVRVNKCAHSFSVYTQTRHGKISKPYKFCVKEIEWLDTWHTAEVVFLWCQGQEFYITDRFQNSELESKLENFPLTA